MEYLAVLGRLPKLSLAELESLFFDVKIQKETGENWLATFQAGETPNGGRLGGSLKLGVKISGGSDSLLGSLSELPDGKIVLGVSDFRKGATVRRAQGEALKLKKALKREGRSVRVLENKTAVLSTATSHHNQLAEKKNHVEIIMTDFGNYKLIHVQNISEYAKRDHGRPARDARVGMLPPKLAQILVNLNGELPEGATILDPFCGTGVVLQEALLDGYVGLGTDLNPRMVEYSERNLKWLMSEKTPFSLEEAKFKVEVGDALNMNWVPSLITKVDGVAAEVYLGAPMSRPPAEIKLRQEKINCRAIILGFLKNLSRQVESGTPVTLAIPAWLRENGEYERLGILDEIEGLGYNTRSFRNLSQEGLLYFREGQVVAREIIVLRKK